MSDRPYVVDEMISAKAIAARIEALAQEITRAFAGTEKLVVVGLLRGSFVFIADLVRELRLPVEVDFLEASSYGNTMESSREVRILKDLRSGIEGRDVLVVEDIVDTGHTLNHVIALLKSRKPKRLKSIRRWPFVWPESATIQRGLPNAWARRLAFRVIPHKTIGSPGWAMEWRSSRKSAASNQGRNSLALVSSADRRRLSRIAGLQIRFISSSMPRPSLISVCSALDTTSREASSI